MTKPATAWIDSASPTVVTHYKALLDTNHLGQWSMFSKTTGKEIRPTVTIEAVRPYVPERRREVKLPDGRRVPEPIKRYEIRFKGIAKTWLAGPVSLATLAALYGNKPSDWIGKQVTLWHDPNVTMGRRRVGGIRILDQVPTGPDTNEPLDADADEDAARGIAEAVGDLESAAGGASAGASAVAQSQTSAATATNSGTKSQREPGED